MKHIQNLLADIQPLSPLATNIKPLIPDHLEIKAFLFDIYGTLLISSSGDIQKADLSGKHLIRAFENAGIRFNTNQDKILVANNFINEMKQEILLVHKQQKEKGIPYPEVDILAIFKKKVRKDTESKDLSLSPQANLKLALFGFEFLSNKIFPMPGLKEVIATLHRNNKILGIISNAQFYTPVIMNYYLNNTISENDTVPPFAEKLTVFSYKEKKAKPDKQLFTQLIPLLEKNYGIAPEHVLYTGNDMQNDILPAHQVGFKTALFAGDKRSLRLREEKPGIKEIQPDCIVTELKQLLALY